MPLDKADYLCGFVFLPRVFGVVLPCLEFFYCILMFSAATYSQVTVTSSFVACTNAEISASCALSTKEGDKIWSIPRYGLCDLCGLRPANFQEYQLMVTFRIFRSLFWTSIKCNVLQFPTDFCCLATPLKVNVHLWFINRAPPSFTLNIP